MPKPGATGAPPGFFATTVRLCAGTKIFPEIYRTSPGRAFWRFFLLTLLCAILAAVVATLVQGKTFRQTGQALDEEIGAIVVTPEKITLQKDPDTPRRLRLPYAMMEYFPGDTFDRKDFNADRVTDIGFVILPGGLATWSTGNWKGENIFNASFLPAESVFAMFSSGKMQDGLVPSWGMFSGPGLAETLKKKFSPPAGKPENAADRHSAETDDKTAAAGDEAGTDAESGAAAEAGNEEKAGTPGGKPNGPRILLTGSDLARSALSVLTFATFLMTFFGNFFQIGLIILLVSIVQYLRASTLPKGITYKNVLTIMIYSTFPAQIVATLFDAAGATGLLSFQLLFVCIFFVYQIFAFRAVVSKVCPPPDRRDDFDDSDF